MNTPSSHRDRTLGLWLGVLGVAIFAVTLPATGLRCKCSPSYTVRHRH